MAKADDASSTIHWIWLLDALREAKEVLGSLVLSKTRLKEWMATGQLPWTYMSWQELDEGGVAKKREDEPSLGRILSALTWFWSAESLWTDWEDNSAGDLRNCAFGIKASHKHLRTLLRPEEPREGEEMGAGAWIADEARRMKVAGEIPADIGITDFARELESRMGKAATRDRSLRAIKWKSIRNELKAWGLWPVTSIK